MPVTLVVLADHNICMAYDDMKETKKDDALDTEAESTSDTKSELEDLAREGK